MAGEMKKYIISFQATLKGHKMVMSQLKGMTGSVTKVKHTTDKAGKSTQKFSNILIKAGKRALIVAPVWLLLRGAMMKVIRTVSDAIQGFTDLDDQLARIRTVMRGTAKDIENQMMVIKGRILDVAKDSRIPIRELAEGFYFLKTANLDAMEATIAFEHTVNLAIGTANNMAESARAVAGIYNTMGIYLGDNLTVHEKFQKIADVLAYTYATQDVQLSELIQSYTKLAPYVTGLSDNFTELTTMLGFLNTRLLRGGRTGRLTGRAILQITKNAEKLARQLDITFKPDEPVNFLNTIRKVREELGIVGKVTAEQSQILQDIFATRGGVAIRLLIEHFDELEDQIKDAIEGADGFAKKMKELRMGTIAGQMERMRNIMIALLDDFLSTAYGTENLVRAMKNLASSLEMLQPVIHGTGTALAWFGAGVREDYYWVRALAQAMQEIETPEKIGIAFGVPPIGVYRRVGELVEQYRREDIRNIKETTKGRDEYLKREQKVQEYNKKILDLRKEALEIGKKEGIESEKYTKLQEKIEQLEEERIKYLPESVQLQIMENKQKDLGNKLEKKGLSYLDKIEEKEKSRLRMMKIMGANALDIAKAELEIAENVQVSIDRREEELNILKAQYKVAEERARHRREIINVLQRAEIDMAKALGASELQILELREQHLDSIKEEIGDTQYLYKLGQLRIQQAIAIQTQKEKERQITENIVMAYHKADKFEKGRVRRLTELVQMPAEDLASRVQDAYDLRIITDYWQFFTDKAKKAVTEALRLKYRLPEIEIPTETLSHAQIRAIEAFWTHWKRYGDITTEEWAKSFANILKTVDIPIPAKPGEAPSAKKPTISEVIKPKIAPEPVPRPMEYKGRFYGAMTKDDLEKILRDVMREETERKIEADIEENRKTRESLERIKDSTDNVAGSTESMDRKL